MFKNRFKSKIRISKTCFLLYCCLFFLYSCVSELPFDNNYESVPVVNCLLTANESIQRLSLTESNITEGKLKFKEIVDAKIFLSVDDDSVVGEFIRMGSDNWQLNYIPLEGRTYNLRVLLSTGKILTATTKMPVKNNIVSNSEIDQYPSKNFIQYSTEYPCWVSVISSDSFLLPKKNPTIRDVIKDAIGTNHILADKFNMNGSLLDFLPTADTPKYMYYIRIASDPDITSDLRFKIQTNYGNYTYVCFCTSSIEYDLYLKSTILKVMNRLDPSDPAIWFDESRVYSNINNGIGIFGAYTERIIRYNDNN